MYKSDNMYYSWKMEEVKPIIEWKNKEQSNKEQINNIERFTRSKVSWITYATLSLDNTHTFLWEPTPYNNPLFK